LDGTVSTRKIDRDDIQMIWAETPAEWRAWLEKHHATEPGVWLHYWKKATGKPSVDWPLAVEEALCFGWIDSIRRGIDEHSFKQYFAPRKPKGTWSRINKETVERLVAEGRMQPAGLAAVEIAKANGSWETLDSVEAMEFPEDLRKALRAQPGAMAFVDSLAKFAQWQLLYWINAAKRPETRQSRIDEIVRCAAEGRRPDRFTQPRRKAGDDEG
jgi:uncharacterized protein YdeI (YjbR/CyaY-like superfamily)